MAYISVSNSFANNSVADATAVNTNFSDIINGTSDGTKDISVAGITGATGSSQTFNGNVTIGATSAKDLTINASLASSIAIKTTYSYDIGSSTIGLKRAYFGSIDSAAKTTVVIAGTVATSNTFTLPIVNMTMPTALGADLDYLQMSSAGVVAAVGGPTIASKTTTYVTTTNDKIIHCDTSGGAWTLTLYASSGQAGRRLFVKKTTSDYSVLTIDGNASETIDGATTIKLNTQYETVELYCDGSNWHIARRFIPCAWKSFTPTGTWSTNTTYAGFRRRVGDSEEYDVYVTVSGAPDTASLNINIPNSLNIDTAKLSGSTAVTQTYMGTVRIFDSSASQTCFGVCRLVSGSTTQVIAQYIKTSGTEPDGSGSVTQAAPMTFASGDVVHIRFTVPIVNWEG